MSIRTYIDLLETEPVDPPFPETRRLCRLAGLDEGRLIPFPARVLRISGAPLDFYQLLKMTANPNLAHNVTYEQTKTDAGTNLTEVVMCFYDEVSHAEAKDLFDHYGISYTEEAEVDSPMAKLPFKSKRNPPTDGDLLYGTKHPFED